MGLEGFFWTYRTGRVSSDLLFGPWCSGHLPLSTGASLALGSWVNGLEPHSLVVLCPWVGDSGHGSSAAAEQRAAKARPELLFVWSSRDAGTAGISSVGCGMVHLPRFLSCCCGGQIKMAGVLQCKLFTTDANACSFDLMCSVLFNCSMVGRKGEKFLLIVNLINICNACLPNKYTNIKKAIV